LRGTPSHPDRGFHGYYVVRSPLAQIKSTQEGNMMLQGRYQLERELGSGAHGTVYRGLDTQTNTPIAIKHLRPDVAQRDPDLLKRFQREAEALRRLNHPNIVQVLAAFAEANNHYIVMEYLPGGSLQDLLKQTPRLPREQVLRIALDLSDALIRAHRLEIIHRDLKPANIMLASDGTPRLTDFGVAMMRDQERITDTRGIVGTWAYIAPEVINSNPYDARADIWSFGVMLYELLAGRRPFDDSTMTGLIVAILTQPPADLEVLRPDVPPALIDLVYRMLDKIPQARISSMRRVGAELEAILQRLVSGDSTSPTSMSLSRLPETDQIRVHPRIKHNLPAQTTPFVGREREMEELLRLVQPASKSSPRLVNVIAPGGMGKSRLSLEAAQTLLEQPVEITPFPDGIYFVSLAPITTSDRIPQAIADVVGYAIQNDGRQLHEQIATFLAERRILLILDNFEHLIEGTPLVSRLLTAAPHLTILITSRERLNLSAEYVFALDGLRVPSTNITSPLEYSAVQLFVQSAQRVAPSFKLEDADVPHVAAICRLVDGLPLGLMLAATWIELLTPQEIASELSKSGDFLEATLHDLPERHHSMRAVFDYSWRRLTPSEQKPFSRAAAQAVTGASLRDLMQMVNKSLLHRDRDRGYYDLHELIRQFAESHLKTNETTYQAALEAHSRYYCGWLKELLPIMHGTQVSALKAMDSEIDNIRQAWQQAIERKDIEVLGGAEETYALYCAIRNLQGNLVHEFTSALIVLEALPTTPLRNRVLGRMYSRLGFNYPPYIDHKKAHDNLERSIHFLRLINDEIGLSYALYCLAYNVWEKDIQKSMAYAQEALTLAQKHHFLVYEALIDVLFADYYMSFTEQFDTAFDLAQKALTYYKQIQQLHGQGIALGVMVGLYFTMQKHQEMLDVLQQALESSKLLATGVQSLAVG
jgi:serine/threonine protein kinase/tetratricopeptide (TPR) repeat protein